ncbi:MAG: cell surface protein, partial [Gammaproteobacteria bacterium]
TDTTRGKAVKVRFRGAANSDDVLDFQVFMSPGDVWTAAVSQGADGVAQLVTGDNTCTVPALTPGVHQSFITDRLSATTMTPEAKANHTREGYVEIFNMADITPGTALFSAIKHVNSVAPCSNVAAARTLLNTTATTDFATEALAGAAGFDTPTGGLMGDWYIINVPQTTTFSGASTAVVAKDVAGGVSARGNFVHFPQSNTVVAGGTVDAFTADPLLRGAAPIVTPRNYDLPDMSTPYVTSAADPLAQATQLTAALAVQSITNQYANDASITAKTDWVFSMPTRRYSVAANYAVPSTNAAYRVYTALGTNWFTAANTTVDAAGNICVNADAQRFYNREELTPGVTAPGPVFSPNVPGVPAVVRFCGEASVLAFADEGKSVLGASVARQNLLTNIYENGWGVITTTNGGAGLPILGSSFIKLSNPNVGAGVSGTYGITWPHRYTK